MFSFILLNNYSPFAISSPFILTSSHDHHNPYFENDHPNKTALARDPRYSPFCLNVLLCLPYQLRVLQMTHRDQKTEVGHHQFLHWPTKICELVFDIERLESAGSGERRVEHTVLEEVADYRPEGVSLEDFFADAEDRPEKWVLDVREAYWERFWG